jgi:hypothetical protein
MAETGADLTATLPPGTDANFGAEAQAGKGGGGLRSMQQQADK